MTYIKCTRTVRIMSFLCLPLSLLSPEKMETLRVEAQRLGWAVSLVNYQGKVSIHSIEPFHAD